MRIAIISDTHENEIAIEKAVKKIRKADVGIVLHCGDLISPPMLEYFQDFSDFRIVFGNCDGEKEGMIRKCKKYGFEKPEHIKKFDIGGKTFIMAHEPEKIQKKISSGKYDYAIHGHTHMQKDEKVGKTRVINPGAFSRTPYYTFAILDTETDQLDFYEI